MKLPPGKPGEILMRGSDGKWRWVTANDQLTHERGLRRLVIVITSIVISLLFFSLGFCAFSIKLQACG